MGRFIARLDHPCRLVQEGIPLVLNITIVGPGCQPQSGATYGKTGSIALSGRQRFTLPGGPCRDCFWRDGRAFGHRQKSAVFPPAKHPRFDTPFDRNVLSKAITPVRSDR